VPSCCMVYQGLLRVQREAGIHFYTARHARLASGVLAAAIVRCGPMLPLMCSCGQPADGVGLRGSIQQLQQPSKITRCCCDEADSTVVCAGCISQQAHTEHHQVSYVEGVGAACV
jgi:hypothetical protein